MNTTPPVSTAMVRIAELAAALGANPINRQPGAWEYTVRGDRDILVRVNPHPDPIDVDGSPLEGFHARFDVDGLPVLLISPFGGAVIGDMTEDWIIAALEAEIGLVEAGLRG